MEATTIGHCARFAPAGPTFGVPHRAARCLRERPERPVRTRGADRRSRACHAPPARPRVALPAFSDTSNSASSGPSAGPYAAPPRTRRRASRAPRSASATRPSGRRFARAPRLSVPGQQRSRGRPAPSPRPHATREPRPVLLAWSRPGPTGDRRRRRRRHGPPFTPPGAAAAPPAQSAPKGSFARPIPGS
jgi:hypothetical protein